MQKKKAKSGAVGQFEILFKLNCLLISIIEQQVSHVFPTLNKLMNKLTLQFSYHKAVLLLFEGGLKMEET